MTTFLATNYGNLGAIVYGSATLLVAVGLIVIGVPLRSCWFHLISCGLSVFGSYQFYASLPDAKNGDIPLTVTGYRAALVLAVIALLLALFTWRRQASRSNDE